MRITFHHDQDVVNRHISKSGSCVEQSVGKYSILDSGRLEVFSVHFKYYQRIGKYVNLVSLL